MMRLFDEATLRKLEQLTLAADAVRVGAMKGDRRSRKRGASIEFADYRDYAQGDDLRRLDWNVFARLERPFIKLTEEEEDLAVHILVDTSASMDWPLPLSGEDQGEDRPAENKLRYALQLAGALGYVGLTSGDLVMATLFDSAGQRAWGPFRGRANGWPLIQFLEASYGAIPLPGPLPPVEGARKTALDLSLRHYALRARRPGLLFLISDLLSPPAPLASLTHAFPASEDADSAGRRSPAPLPPRSPAFLPRDGLAALQSRGYEIALLHLLSPDEVAPELSGDLKLVDVETGETVEVSLDPATIEAYLAGLAAWREAIRAFCGPRGIHYISATTDRPWDALILQTLRRQGVVR